MTFIASLTTFIALDVLAYETYDQLRWQYETHDQFIHSTDWIFSNISLFGYGGLIKLPTRSPLGGVRCLPPHCDVWWHSAPADSYRQRSVHYKVLFVQARFGGTTDNYLGRLRVEFVSVPTTGRRKCRDTPDSLGTLYKGLVPQVTR